MKRSQARGGRRPIKQIDTSKVTQPRESTADGLVNKGGKSDSAAGNLSASTTPRFPVSVFNTPRDPVEMVCQKNHNSFAIMTL